MEKKTDLEKFMSFLPKKPKDECWEWLGMQDTNNGYGLFYCKGKQEKAHRMSVRFLKGEVVPKGMVVMHLCHNKPCVNPDHLRVGTESENIQMDYDRGSRCKKGENSPFAKVNRHDVFAMRELRKMGITYKKIATVFPIGEHAVGEICRRKKWAHI